MTTIVLPWPPAVLSPNSRADRRAATAARQSYRAAGFYAVRALKAAVPADAHLEITFCPPDARRRDLDNMLAAIKVGLDGIARAAKVDDYGWSLSIRRAAPVRGGAVRVRVASPDAWQSIGALAATMTKGQIE